VCERVERRSFVKPILAKASGKRDRFPSGEGDEERWLGD
jgi:hypothetical protein